jgi:hypothetical protein
VTDGTELVYKGWAAGSLWSSSGGGSNYQCVTEEPEHLSFGPGTIDVSLLYGTEYRAFGNVPPVHHQVHAHDVPCAVCYASFRAALLMVPGKYSCPSNWTREYYGYLMAERSHILHKGRSTFECVDASPETVPGGLADNQGALFFHVEPRCGSLPCPPYQEQKEITCAVCTR